MAPVHPIDFGYSFAGDAVVASGAAERQLAGAPAAMHHCPAPAKRRSPDEVETQWQGNFSALNAPACVAGVNGNILLNDDRFISMRGAGRTLGPLPYQ